MQKILEIFRTVPNYELAKTWSSDMTIMLRMTSKIIRDAVDNARLPATVSLIWPIYKTDIIKINSIIRRLNITSLAIKYFDLETDEYFDEDRYITKCPHDNDEDDDEDDDEVDDILTAEAAIIYQHQREDAHIKAPPGADDKVDDEDVDEVEVRLQEILKYEEDKLLKLSEMFSLNKGLTVLDLRQSELENNSFKFFKEAFPKLQNLSDLILDGNHFSWSLDFIELLMLLPKLIRLNLNSNPFINEIKGDILPGQTLHLKELSLRSCDIACGSYNILKFIEICPKLVCLDLGDNGLDDEWMKRLPQALLQCPNLAYVDLSDNYINAEGTTYITKLFKSHNFVSLELAYNNFGDEGVTNIANALCNTQCPNLTNLNLCDNKFGDEGATNIANALCNAQCPNLTNLNLSSNKIRDKGATNIVNVLLLCPNLTCLDFRSNMIGDEGATNIAKVLPQCSTLTCLNLSSNMIRDKGAINIANVLSQCPTLNCLNLVYNMIRDKGIMRLKEIQSQCYNLAPKQLLFDDQLTEHSKRFRRKN